MSQEGVDRLVLLSTCGISVLTNAVPAERKWLVTMANQASVEDSRLEGIVDAARTELEAADIPRRRVLSAELNAVVPALERFQPNRVQHLLIHTDTAVGRAASGLVRGVLERDGNTVAEVTAGGLRTDDADAFRAALARLTVDLDETIAEYRGSGWTVVFNLTGGFKSLNAYLQAYGMLVADACVFLFERASDLIEIPGLPVQMDEGKAVTEHLTVFRRLAAGYTISRYEVQAIPGALMLVDGDQATTSVWGDVVWSRCRRAVLAKELCSPLSPKVTVAPAVQHEFRGLPDAQRIEVNDALDAFSAFMDGVRPLVASRAFKQLRGAPVPGSTHELYAWSTGATGRLFGHYEPDGSFVFDKLLDHL